MSSPCPCIFQNQTNTALPMPKQLNPLLFQNAPVQPSAPKMFYNNTMTGTASTAGLIRPL